MKLKADDSKILAKVDEIVERKSLQEDLDSISVWMRDWKMNLNIAKSKMWFILDIQIFKQNIEFKIFMTTESEKTLE